MVAQKSALDQVPRHPDTSGHIRSSDDVLIFFVTYLALREARRTISSKSSDAGEILNACRTEPPPTREILEVWPSRAANA